MSNHPCPTCDCERYGKKPDGTTGCAAPAMAQMLRSLEWAAMDYRDMEPRCSECDARAKDGHAPDCKLAALIKEIP